MKYQTKTYLLPLSRAKQMFENGEVVYNGNYEVIKSAEELIAGKVYERVVDYNVAIIEGLHVTKQIHGNYNFAVIEDYGIYETFLNEDNIKDLISFLNKPYVSRQ